MSTLLVVVVSISLLLLAYRFYGNFLARKIFQLDDQMEVPSKELQDDIDFVPTKRSIVFGHHFTSIAGTGPIVGPAVAVFWGWLPALLWVVFGGIFIGAVHDFGALVLSLRNKGQTIGEIAGRVISPRAKVLFLLVLFFALSIVLAIFGLVIAGMFTIYPASVFATWVSLPLAIVMGLILRKQPEMLLPLTVICVLLVFAAIWAGNSGLTISINPEAISTAIGYETTPKWINGITTWTVILLTYCFVASVIPVWILLQPRDFINSWILIIALTCLFASILFASMTGKADLISSAPMVTPTEMLPSDMPPMFPFLFITIACGAISGFHCLVSSGTTSKQIEKASHAKSIGYGGMLLESGLAIAVIVACCAGIGMGSNLGADDAADGPAKLNASEKVAAVSKQDITTSKPAKYARWSAKYDGAKPFKGMTLGDKVSAFVDGGANFLKTFAIPFSLGQTFLAVLVSCFAATTLDTATRLQRYVIQELATTIHVKPLTNKYAATGLAVILGGVIAFIPVGGVPGKGGLLLWPLFGAVNQLLASLALLVIFVFLWRRKLPAWIVGIPLVMMTIIPIWGLFFKLNTPDFLRSDKPNWLLSGFGIATLILHFWMIIEALIILPKVKGIMEEPAKVEKVNA